MLRADQLDPDRACALLIDLQESLLPLIPGSKAIVAATIKLLDGLRIFRVPVLATEQYPKGLGGTEASVRSRLGTSDARIVEKSTFSACGEGLVRDALQAIDRPQIILSGIETHVCVQQTALDLLSMDYDVFICADAVGSRAQLDHQCALNRLASRGAHVITVEAALFELCNRCDTPQFKEMLTIIKDAPHNDS